MNYKIGDTVIANTTHTSYVTQGKKYKLIDVIGNQLWVICDDGIRRYGSSDLFRKGVLKINKYTKII